MKTCLVLMTQRYDWNSFPCGKEMLGNHYSYNKRGLTFSLGCQEVRKSIIFKNLVIVVDRDIFILTDFRSRGWGGE